MSPEEFFKSLEETPPAEKPPLDAEFGDEENDEEDEGEDDGEGNQ